MLQLLSYPRCVACGALTLLITFASIPASADNPIIQTLYTADPAPMVHDGRLYLYTTHDEDVTVGGFFTMNDWRVYSTTDVVNWTDHGSPLHYRDFSWADKNAWAGQVIYRNDKFYFYVPVVRPNGGGAIGVGVSDSPIGPFTDAIGEPLVTSGCGDIDPTVFIDDDDQAYLYWGNPKLCYVKLNSDMISYQGGVVEVDMNTGSFGARSDDDRPTSYEEGPWFYKRADLYYMVYPGGPLPEHIAYSTSSSPTGPWVYQDVIMPAEGGSFTNHPGVIDFAGKSLFFYHNGALPGGGGYKRSVAVEEFTYGPDGSIPELRMTEEGASAVASLNPFERVEAETMAWNSGVETEVCNEGGMNVTAIDAGDYIKLKEVEFGVGATSLELRVAATSDSSAIEIHLDSTTGSKVGTCPITSTGGGETWATQTCELAGAEGKHDVFLVFSGGGFKFDWWRVSGPGEPGDDTSAASDAGVTSAESTAGTAPNSDGSQSETTTQAPNSTAADSSAVNATGNGATSTVTNSVGSSTASAPSSSRPVGSSSENGGSTMAPDSIEESSSNAVTSDAVTVSTASKACGCRVGAQSPYSLGLLCAFATLATVAGRRASRTSGVTRK